MADDSPAQHQTFALNKRRPPKSALAKIGGRVATWGGAALLVAGLTFGAWAMFKPKADADPYRLASVERGDIVKTVSASGTLEARETVKVGSQLSGLISAVYADFNDHVKKGQMLARLDPSTYQSRVNQGAASVNASSANLGQQQANLVSAQAKAAQAQADYNRIKMLFDKGYASRAALDISEAALKTANASVDVARAQIAASGANVEQSRATLSSSQFDLNRTQIVAPIDGVIIDRQIEPGQTVAASFSAPVLFIIAGDLTQLQAEILVDEADIGQVRPGMEVKFTVDAFPDQNFAGTVHQIRLEPQTQNGVVAYDVVVYAENPGEKLLPGMTANADIVISQFQGVLKVPSAALRFQPVDPNAKSKGPSLSSAVAAGSGVPSGGSQGQNKSGGQWAANTTIIEQLGLSDDQKKKVQPIMDKARQDAATRMAAAGSDRRKIFREASAAAFDQIRPLLTTGQQTKLEVLRVQLASDGDSGSRKGVVYVLRDTKPVAIPVRLGASDGAFTMVETSELKEGDQVITGGGPHAKVDLKSLQGRRF